VAGRGRRDGRWRCQVGPAGLPPRPSRGAENSITTAPGCGDYGERGWPLAAIEWEFDGAVMRLHPDAHGEENMPWTHCRFGSLIVAHRYDMSARRGREIPWSRTTPCTHTPIGAATEIDDHAVLVSFLAALWATVEQGRRARRRGKAGEESGWS